VRRALAIAVLVLGVAAGALALRLRPLLDAASATNAKILCSAVFVSGRDLSAARRESLPLDPPGARVELDLARREVRVAPPLGGFRTARFTGDQGCVALPAAGTELAIEPRPVESALPPAAAVPWPMGDRDAAAPPGGFDAERMQDAAARAFARPADHTAAFLVLHRGRIAAERYAPGVHRDMQLESWSMGKSLTATLVGRLAQQGRLELAAPAPVPEWQAPGDPRRAITVLDLLRMQSGLRFSGATDSLAALLWRGLPDHLRIYTGMADVFDFAVSRPAEHPPGTVGRYRNSDPLVLGAIARRIVEARGEDYWRWPQRVLFDRIGIRRQVLETDPHGNFLLTGFDYGTARSWARLGLLYLRDGVWQGERLLPEGFAELAAKPAPAWDEPVYGGGFWLNRTGRAPLPRDAYWMGGRGVQRVIVVPSLELVVVRLGHTAGAETAEAGLHAALVLVQEAIAGAP